MASKRAAEIKERNQRTRTLKILPYVHLVKRKFYDKPEIFNTFWHIMNEYKDQRIGIPEVLLRISDLFGPHQEFIQHFCCYLPYAVIRGSEYESECDDLEMLRFAKKAKLQDGSAKSIIEFGSSSIATAGCSPKYSHSTDSIYASGSSSSYSYRENVAQPYYAQKEKALCKIYVPETQYSPGGSLVYIKFIELVNEIKTNRNDIYDIMQRASIVLKGCPELIEGFNKFLPDGFKIVIRPKDNEMDTD